MSPENTSPSKTKICPTCGTRLAETATRCLVCGTELNLAVEAKKPAAIQANRMPEITLSLPAVLGLLALFLAVGALLVFIILRMTGTSAVSSPAAVTATITPTTTATVEPTEALTFTPVPTATTQPPFDYTIATGDTCTSIAVSFGVSVQSIIILNNLPAQCNTLSIGQQIKVPYATPTPLPAATNTLEPAQATLAACNKVVYTVQENDTLGTISANYAVPAEAIKAYNGLPTDNVYLGMPLTIPLCERAATPGPTPTATIPPPYPAANLLLPADGASFTLADDSISLQWASIGTLRDNESYLVTIEDVTDGQGRRLTEYVNDTKFIVPVSFRPKDNAPHIYRWFITTVRQTGSDEQGKPIWDSAGENSLDRVFSWQGIAPEATTKP
ncbi:MAG: LysM peptidoglycan-binding domain-containing protein [Chloroflexota bacterium]